MTLQWLGPISLADVSTELSLPAGSTISLGLDSARILAGITSGQISLSNFYGKSARPAGSDYTATFSRNILGGETNQIMEPAAWAPSATYGLLNLTTGFLVRGELDPGNTSGGNMVVLGGYSGGAWPGDNQASAPSALIFINLGYIIYKTTATYDSKNNGTTAEYRDFGNGLYNWLLANSGQTVTVRFVP